MKLFPAIEKAVLKGSSSGKKKSFRYKVVLKGTVLSKHTTKKLATAKANSVRGARVMAIGATVRRKPVSRKRKPVSRRKRRSRY